MDFEVDVKNVTHLCKKRDGGKGTRLGFFMWMFSTDPDPEKSKTKAMWMTISKKTKMMPVPLTLNGRNLLYVTSLNHLGHRLTVTGKMVNDTQAKRIGFIRRSDDINETFAFAHPRELQELVKTHAGAFYGSNLWELWEEEAAKGCIAQNRYRGYSI